MVTSEHSFLPTAISPRIGLWLATVAVLASLLALLTKVVMDDPAPSQDIAIMDWFAGWQPPGLVNFFEVLSALTGIHAGLIYGPAGIVILLLMRKVRAAIAFGAVGFTVAVVAANPILSRGCGRVRLLPLMKGRDFTVIPSKVRLIW